VSLFLFLANGTLPRMLAVWLELVRHLCTLDLRCGAWKMTVQDTLCESSVASVRQSHRPTSSPIHQPLACHSISPFWSEEAKNKVFLILLTGNM
jgi:hypothetical protein